MLNHRLLPEDVSYSCRADPELRPCPYCSLGPRPRDQTWSSPRQTLGAELGIGCCGGRAPEPPGQKRQGNTGQWEGSEVRDQGTTLHRILRPVTILKHLSPRHNSEPFLSCKCWHPEPMDALPWFFSFCVLVKLGFTQNWVIIVFPPTLLPY